MAHFLVFTSENGKPRTFPVVEERISIGRHPKNAIVLENENVSVYHAEVIRKNGEVLLRDLGSSNGTKLNRKRITEAALNEGDEIRFGPLVCHFRSEKKRDSKPPDAKIPDEKKPSASAVAPPAKMPIARKGPETKAVMKKAAPSSAIAEKPKPPVPPVPKASEKTPSSEKAPADKPAGKKTSAEKPSPDKAPSQQTPAKKTSGEKSSPEKSPPPPDKPAEPEPPLPWHRKFLLRVTESRYFVLSLLIHATIVALAGGIVLYKMANDAPDFVSSGGDGLIGNTDDLPQPPEVPNDSVPTTKIVQQTPSATAPTVDIIKTTTSSSSFKVAMPQVPMKTLSAADLTKNFGSSRSLAASLPGSMNGRMGSGRQRAMALNGMKEKSERAVMRGLTWLQQNQNDDGSWGDENRAAMTGFGLLCFLGHGELQDSPAFGKTVGRALMWIVENGALNEGRLHMAKAFTSQGVYEHAICAYALGEYYSMTRDQRVVPLLRLAVGHIIEGQGPGGGWMYSYDKSGDDLSVSGWQIQALKAAHLSQIMPADVDRTLTKAVAYLEKIKGPKGGYGYRGPSDDYSLTGVGILCQLFWKGERGDLRKNMTWLLDETEKGKPVKYKGASADLYAWYYHTQACLMFGGEAWTKWNAWFQDEICDAQSDDGSWPIPGGNAIGPQNSRTITGAVYRTTLCVLMLEVFYRYMPTTRG